MVQNCVLQKGLKILFPKVFIEMYIFWFQFKKISLNPKISLFKQNMWENKYFMF